MKNLNNKFNQEEQIALATKFLEAKTNHNIVGMKCRKGIKCDLSVTLISRHKVSFWFDGSMVFYGLVGYGIFSAVDASDLIEETNE